GMLVEFNEILLKACEAESARRYQSAGEMRADLELLQGGKSVKRKRALQHWWSVGKKAGLVGSLFLIAVAASLFALHRLPDTYMQSTIPEVNDLVDQGDHCLDGRASDRLLQAKVYFNRAIELDPGFVPA